MTQDEIIELARQAGLDPDLWNYTDAFEVFAKLVAAHTLMSIDPSKFMSWQEGFEVGVAKEREACESIEYDLAKSPAMFATMAEYKAYKDGVQDYRTRIIARGEA